jgi:hypothetical protein
VQLSRREILDEVLDFVGENSDSNARNTAERLINRAIWNLWTKMAWRQFQVAKPYTFSTVSGTDRYVLPAYFGRITSRDGIIRDTTNGAKLYPSNLTDIQERDPALESSGDPQVYAIANTVGVAVQVAAAGESLEVVSSNASDTDILVTIVGLGSSGDYKREQYTMNGTTAVALGTWTYVLEFSKAYPAASTPATELTSSRGTVTLRVASGGATRQTLLAYESAREHWEITLYPTPNVVHTISVPYMRLPTKLLYDADLAPMGWGAAIVEEMIAMWRENTGEVKSHATIPRPALLDLISLENSNRFGVASRTQPFRG